jgi:hypothetical protein
MGRNEYDANRMLAAARGVVPNRPRQEVRIANVSQVLLLALCVSLVAGFAQLLGGVA